MTKIIKRMLPGAALLVLVLGVQVGVRAQTVEPQREPSANGGSVPQPPSAKRRILLNIARAVIDVLCAEYGDCRSTTNTPSTGTAEPTARDDRRYLGPGFAGPYASTPAAGRLSFSYATPPGWQSYEGQRSVTVALPGEYVNGDLANGVILGLLDLNNAGFEAATETYVRETIVNNKYLRRIGGPQSDAVDGVPCIINRMEGLSPKTHYVESVVAYTCRRSPQELFYVVTVNSGPYAGRYEEENSRITQSISFRR